MLSQTSSLSEHKLSVFRLDHWDLDQDAACLYSVRNLSLMRNLTGTVQCYELKKEKKVLCCNTFAASGKYVRFKCILLALQGWNYRIFRKMKLLKIICLHYTEDTYLKTSGIMFQFSPLLNWNGGGGDTEYSKSKIWSHTFVFVNSKKIQLLIYSFWVMLAGFKMQRSERIQKHLQMQSSLWLRSTGSFPVLSDSKYGIHSLLACWAKL